MKIEEAKKTVCEWTATMLAEGIVTATEATLSLRCGQSMVITPAIGDPADWTADDMVEVRLADLSWEGDRHPAATYALHAAVYCERKDMYALIHSQLPATLTCSRAGRSVPPLLDDMAQIVGVSARIAPFQAPATNISIRGSVKAFKHRSACLLEDHGALCGAGTFDDAHAVAQVLEKNCKAAIETAFLGGGAEINRVEAALMRFIYLLKYSKQAEDNK